jgi:diguanylate cyclase (GGDEF)-like protein
MINNDDIFKARLLVVDDMQDNVEVLSMLLNTLGYHHVDGTTNPSQVARLHEEHNYDLILLDMQMPGMSGFEVMERLKRDGNDDYLPVLAVTSHSHLKIRALEAGARDFISKPFDPRELEQRIHNFLEVRLLYKQVAEHCRAQEVLALHDALTGLPNRRLLEDRLQTAMRHASRNKLMVAVLYLDLDGFKDVNDHYGHDCGDKLLKTVAERLLSTCRQEDTIARIGGDEFIVVLSAIHDRAAVHRLADELVRALAQPYPVDGHAANISVSIGIAFFPEDASSVESLVNDADQALYEAKRNGKNRYVYAASLRTSAKPAALAGAKAAALRSA